eukprot:CAMPEP_0206488908 /NCGR_PEP_ID=MMETSP0324_2-20121206/42765_1 /ASSEMBLY_ACC=CAM_ASM_000836 /TAXON_ID=2866 /ORGANISM="Crypthecodinium cohnii, Strain Seligo" /LENGTH=31 /DNA_ID= /DNA_START= /DNA_END= /DNA_ORIENTATION=
MASRGLPCGPATCPRRGKCDFRPRASIRLGP